MVYWLVFNRTLSIDGAQRDALLRRANIKKDLWITKISTQSSHLHALCKTNAKIEATKLTKNLL